MTSLLGLQNYYQTHRKEAWDQVAHQVAQHAEPGDLVVFIAGYVDVPFNYYFQREKTVIDQYPVTLERVEPADLRQLERTVEDRERVWLVRSHAAAVDPTDSVLSTLQRSHARHERSTFEGIDLYLMRSDSG